MNERREVEGFNDASFDGSDDVLAFRTALPVGSIAPAAAVTVAETGEAGRLSD